MTQCSVKPWKSMYTYYFRGLIGWLLWHTGGAKLDSPQNIKVIALNTNYIISWDWGVTVESVTFTAQCIGKHKFESNKRDWHTVCKDVEKMSCDLTSCDLLYRGIYILQVRANVNGSHSNWARKEFWPDRDAAVGPPSALSFFPAGSDLDISINDPVTTTNSSMKKLIPKLYYQILYWECCQYTQALGLNTSVNKVTLSNLKSWTWYCVSIQSRLDYFMKRSNFTSPRCIQTKGTPPWWKLLLYFLVSLGISVMLMLLLLYGFFRLFKCLLTTFHPENRLTLQFKKYFCQSLGSGVPHLLTPKLDFDVEHFDNVFICPKVVPKTHNIPEETFLKHHQKPGTVKH